MIVEQLLQPRYKVIADYPNSPFTVGEIVDLTNECFIGNSLGYDSYPLIFKRLEWWEERKPEDMPEYVKRISDNAVFKLKSGQYVLTLIEKIGVDTYEFEYIVTAFLPATKADYDYYIWINK